MKEFRPRLVASESTKFLIDLIREEGADIILSRLQGGSESIEFNEKDYTVSSQSERIRTVENLLEAAEVDRNIYDIERKLVNKWDQHSVTKGLVELFQVKAWLRPKVLKPVDTEWLSDYLDALVLSMSKQFEPREKVDLSGKPQVLAMADLHCGALTKDMKLVVDYNLLELRNRLERISDTINKIGRPTRLKILGDLIESFTGKNHKDTWKRIHMHGMEVALTVYDLLLEFLQKTPYITEIDIISGNHDRITSANDDDSQGQVAYFVAELLKRHYKLPVNYDPLLLANEHDGVFYIETHGHKPISRKKGAQLAFDYGKQGMYNVILMAHKHTEEVLESSSKHRVQRVPSIIPGDRYAESLGEHSASGFVIIESNDVGTVDIKIKGL